MKPNAGVDAIAQTLGNATAAFAGTATATTSTTLTSSGFSGSPAYVGMTVYAGSVYGVITSHTTTVLTVERWVNPTSPGGAAGTTPSATSPFLIMPGITGAGFMGLTANTSAPGSGDTALTGEIATAGGGLIRKVCSFAHTGGTTTYTQGATFTANGSDSLGSPVTIHKVGLFNTLTNPTGTMVFETVMSADATITAVGDAVTNTQTVTIS